MPKILAIDDKSDNLVTIRALLKHLKPELEVLTAQSGKEGIEIARMTHPDTIILDIIMPGMDGYETCNILKSDPRTRDIPVLMLTAIKTDTASRIKGLQHGADAFFTKPIDPYELSAQVEVLLRIKESEDRLRKDRENLMQSVDHQTRELLKNEIKLNQIFNGFSIPALVLDQNHKITHWNSALEKLSSLRARDMIGTSNQWQMVSNEPMPILADIILDGSDQESLDQVLPEGWINSTVMPNAIEAEKIIFNKDNNQICVYITGGLIKDEFGQVLGALETIQDITRIKKNEIELNKHRKHLEELVNQRTQQLEDKNQELERMNKLFSGREFRIKELRDKVKELEQQLSEIKNR